MRVCCFTNDLEATSIYGEPYRHDIARNVCDEALPALLALYKKYGVRATFYCLASYAKDYPQVVEMIMRDGHEVACHGLVHDSDKAFDVLTYEEQFISLKEAKAILEGISQNEVVSFRAPALRVNHDTPRVLQELHFLTDSSVASQRMDQLMSFGTKNKLGWFTAPRAPYRTEIHNLSSRGDSTITEIPVSAIVIPYISTIMRISPFLCMVVRRLIYWNTCGSNQRIVNFLFHPSEAITIDGTRGEIQHRSGNWLKHLFADVIRMRLKRKNLGPNSLNLLEKEILFWKNKGYEFKTIRECSI